MTIGKNFLRRCCVCKKINIDGDWVGEEFRDYREQIEKHIITDGYCPKHFKEAMEEVDRYKKGEITYL